MSRFFAGLLRSGTGLAGFLILAAFILAAVFAPLLAPADPVKIDLGGRLAPPALVAPEGATVLGQDELGRDMLSRIMYGARTTLLVAFVAVVLGGVIGTLLGLVAGYFGGLADRIISRLVDAQLALPLMLMALIIAAALGPGLVNLVIVLALSGWTRYARILRGEVLALREREFVLSAVAAGAGAWRVLLRHILPNLLNTALVVGTLELARTILLESGLSFLGLGIQPPSPSWGRMLADGRGYFATAWWLATFPGLAIVLVVLSVNLFGDWLQEHVDPRRGGRTA